MITTTTFMPPLPTEKTVEVQWLEDVEIGSFVQFVGTNRPGKTITTSEFTQGLKLGCGLVLERNDHLTYVLSLDKERLHVLPRAHKTYKVVTLSCKVCNVTFKYPTP